MGTTTPIWQFYKPDVGEVGWGGSENTNWDKVDANLTNSLGRSYLAGFGITNNAGAPNSKVDIAAGQAQDVNNAGVLTLASVLTKDLSAAWSVGSGNGGLAQALSLTPSTWYHVFVIKRTDTNVVDGFFDTSVTAANIPAPYTLFRRVGSVKTDGSSHIIPYQQNGDNFVWLTPILDGNGVALTTTYTPNVISVPVGVVVEAFGNTSCVAGQAHHIRPPFSLAMTPSATLSPLETLGAIGTATQPAGKWFCRTNTLSQIQWASVSTSTAYLTTEGWIDTRGRLA